MIERLEATEKRYNEIGELLSSPEIISDIKKMEQMDLLVYPGEHVIFFYEWMNDTTLLVSESAAREGKVIVHPKTLNELVVGGTYQMRSPW